VILAPRGMLKATALQHKYPKKKLFLILYRMLGLQNGIVFHATDDTEMKDVFQHFGKRIAVFKAGNLPGRQPDFIPPSKKQKGQCKIIFVGRIHPIKNLNFLLEALKYCKGRIELTVIATLEDLVYWDKCKKTILDLPNEISVSLLWDQPNELITELIQQHHIFALPTQGENFGHSIFEAIAAGRPVLISDQTPWLNLQLKNAGWDLPLENIEGFVGAIQGAVDMDQDELMKWCEGAWSYAGQYLQSQFDKKVFLKQFS
jgi:glycosyltransferase involved in cell wall biosynthesis